MSSLLIIDDEPNVCYSLQRALESPTLTDYHRRHRPRRNPDASAAVRRTP